MADFQDATPEQREELAARITAEIRELVDDLLEPIDDGVKAGDWTREQAHSTVKAVVVIAISALTDIGEERGVSRQELVDLFMYAVKLADSGVTSKMVYDGRKGGPS